METSIIVKYIVGEADIAERILVENWLKEDAKNQITFGQLQGTWQKSSEIKNIVFDTNKAWKKFSTQTMQKPKTKTITIHPLIKYAAAAMLVLGILLIWNKNTKSTILLAENSSYIIKDLKLEDGSAVKLIKGSLNYPDKFGKNKREVTLRGNAFFRVTSNPERQFTISAANCQIKVLGTSFEINENPNTISVSVLEGKVAFITPTEETILKAGESAEYVVKTKKLSPKNTSENQFSYINKKLRFKNIALKDAIKDIEKYYNVEIEIGNKNLENQLINTQFNNEELDHVLMVLTSTLGIQYHKSSQKIILD